MVIRDREQNTEIWMWKYFESYFLEIYTLQKLVVYNN